MRRARTAAATVVALATLTACARGVAVEPTDTAQTETATTSTADPPPTTPTSSTTSSSTTSSSTGSTGDETSSDPTSPSTAPAADIPQNLRVGISFDTPGVGLQTDAGQIGFDADVARYLAGRLGSERVTFVNAVPDQRDTLLATDQVDLVVAAYSMTPERSGKVTFAGPYLRTGQDLLVSQRSRIRTPAQLRGHTVCSVSGTSSTEALVDDYPGLHLVERPTVGDCVEALRRGEVKAVTSDAAVLTGFARTSRSPDRLLLAGRPFTTETWGVAMDRGDVALCREVSIALRAMVRSGEWEQAVRANLPSRSRLAQSTYRPPRTQTCDPA